MAAEGGTFVQLFGLEVHDPASYAEYRARMTPLLHAHGGNFGIDLEVARMLKGPVGVALNRVFTIEFPDRAASVRFFADGEYRAVRSEWFEPAVGHVARLAEWHAEAPSKDAAG